MRRRQRFAIHIDDELYYDDRLVIVLQVNRDRLPHRALIGTRKNKSAARPWLRWVDATELERRPYRLKDAHRKIGSLPELLKNNNGHDLIDWEPGGRARKGEFQPTCELPGSPQKAEVLACRMAMGLPLWHPDDATYESYGGLIDSGQKHDREKLNHIPQYVPEIYRTGKVERYGPTQILVEE
jgi:hypothetical protein